MILKSFAKINSILKIISKREDGYHEIFSLMHKIDLWDEIEIKKNMGGLKITTNREDLNNEANLAYKAASLFFDRTLIKPQVSIWINKRIPVGGGLGGGSSNAAYTLLGLNELFDFPLKMEELLFMSSEIGSDVPFFLTKSSAIVTGRGDKVEEIECDYEDHKVFLVVPDFSISTAHVYRKFRLTKRDIVNKMATTFKDGCKMSTLKRYLWNDLEKVVLDEFGLLKDIKMKMVKCLGNGLVSGSGSSIFSIIDAEVLRSSEEIREMVESMGFFCGIFDFA